MEEQELNHHQKLFCRYYAFGEHTKGNATLSYSQAYNRPFDHLDDDNGIRDKQGKVLMRSSRSRAANICAVSGRQLLIKPNIQNEIRSLLANITEEMVDAELAKVMIQDDEKNPKVAAIREFNRVKGRIIDRIDHTSKGESVRALTDEQLNILAGRGKEGASTKGTS